MHCRSQLLVPKVSPSPNKAPHTTNITPMHELTAIVPISRMGGRLQLLCTWLPKALDLGICVVLVHDKQDNETGPELRALIKRLNHKNLLFIEDVFKSPGLARNAGLEITATKWIAFWDSDDLVFPEVVIQALRENQNETDVICCQYSEIILKRVKRAKETENRNQLIKNPGIWRLIILRDLVGKVRFREFLMAEDQVFLWEALVFDSKIRFSRRATYAYSKGDPNQATASKLKISHLIKVIEFIKQNQIPKNIRDRNSLIRRLSLTLIRRGAISHKLQGVHHLVNLGPNEKSKSRFGL